MREPGCLVRDELGHSGVVIDVQDWLSSLPPQLKSFAELISQVGVDRAVKWRGGETLLMELQASATNARLQFYFGRERTSGGISDENIGSDTEAFDAEILACGDEDRTGFQESDDSRKPECGDLRASEDQAAAAVGDPGDF